jgi:putative ABC transport system substrate-binding protein
MERRAFVAGVMAFLTAPLAAEAQQTKNVRRIGVISTVELGDPDRKVFVDGMRERGWIEGDSFVLEIRAHGGALTRVEGLTRELIGLNAEVLLVYGDPVAIAARRASAALPIVMVTSGYPVEAGLATSLAKPGGNVTGSSAYAGTELWGKYVELLWEAKPATKSLALLWDYLPPTFPTESPILEEMSRGSQRLGITVRRFEIRSSDDVQKAFDALSRQPVDALFITSGPVNFLRKEIFEFATKHRLVTMTDYVWPGEAQPMLTYTPSRIAMARRAAYFVDRILRGARPGDLPIEQPAKFELVINLKTAKALGLTIPPSLLLRADQVIE